MEVILREHVDNLGRRGEIVKVADGYARNYLLPRKLALLATEGNKKQIERERGKFEVKEADEKRIADAMAQHMANVDIVNFRFTPAELTVKAGTTIRWTNHGYVPHTVDFTDGAVNSGVLNNGNQFTHTFTTPGTYPYICHIHPFMHGTVVVTP